MDYEQDAHSAVFVSGFLLGAIVGAGIALLAAPQAGTRTRRRIRKAVGEIKTSARDQWDDLAEDVKGRVDDAVQGARDRFVTQGGS
jgi:gas vesicle protein